MNKKVYLPLVGLLVLFFTTFCSSFCFSEVIINREVRKEINKRLIDNHHITVIPQLNKITGGFGRKNLIEFYFVKTLSKIFFQDKNIEVKVTDISFEDDGVTFELWNDIFGGGKIRIFFSHEGTLQLNVDDIESALTFSLSLENNLKVITNKKSKTFHLNTSNHLPDKVDTEIMSISDALNKGNKPCGYCFTRFIYLPDSHIENQLAKQEAAILKYTNPLVIDQTLQNYIQEIGNRVLKKWPLPLIGYYYRFQVIEGKEPQAISLPGGHIMVTSALLNSAENEDELEAILAHEIAHVERRHVLRNYHLMVEEARAQAVLAGMAAAFAGAAAASNNQTLATTTLGLSLFGMIALDVYYSGYPKHHEREADNIAILYFEWNSMNKKYLENIFRKFEFWNLITKNVPDPQSMTHPYLEERISQVYQAKFKVLKHNHFISTTKRPMIQIDLLYHETFAQNTSVLVYVNDYSFIKKGLFSFESTKNMYLLLKDENGEKRFDLDEKSIVRDTWGAYLSLDSKKVCVIGNVEKLSLIFEKQVRNISEGGFLEEEIYNFKEGSISF